MKIILQGSKRAYAFELSFCQVQIKSAADLEDEEEFDHVPVDPHGTSFAHLERRSTVEDAYGRGRPGFGFQKHYYSEKRQV